jgi:hypothetical protein
MNHVNIETIVYLQRISDPHISGPLRKSLELVASICGKDAIPRIVLVTTMWSQVTTDVGEEREQLLQDIFWGEMIARGCLVKRFEDSYESAWEIIDASHRKNDTTAPILLAMQIVEERRKLEKTDAGILLHKELKRRAKGLQELDRRLKGKNRRHIDPKDTPGATEGAFQKLVSKFRLVRESVGI